MSTSHPCRHPVLVLALWLVAVVGLSGCAAKAKVVSRTYRVPMSDGVKLATDVAVVGAGK